MPASVAQQIVNTHRAQIRGLIELGGVRKVRGLYEDVRAELEAQLAALVRRGEGAIFTAYHVRQVLLQVRDGLQVFQKGLAPELDAQGFRAATLAQRHVVGALKAFEKRYAGTEPALRLDDAGVFARVYRGVEPTLLHRYHKYTANYPMATIERVRRNLAMSMVKGETVHQAVNRIAARGGIFDSERWRAERIVRTEGAYAYGVSNQRCMGEVAAEMPGLMKKLVATFDDRTGDDSKDLNGQTVPWDKPFVWMKKTKAGVERVEYMQPPNRPNDRECSVPWRADYPTKLPKAGPVDPRLPPRSVMS